MQNKEVYLDHASTTPTDLRVVKEMLPYFSDIYANSSALYRPALKAKQAIEKSRQTIADFLGAKLSEIVFTAGGTESDNLAILGIARFFKKGHIVTSQIEHHAVLNSCKELEKEGFEVTYLKPNRDGFINPQDVKKALKKNTILVSIMYANNEIGTIQPIAEIGGIARAKGIYFHTDAVQTVGHIPVDVNNLNADLLSLSAHKFYGPKGVGALYVRKGTRLETFMQGGDQEKGRRASTQNTPGIVGLARAIELCRDKMGEEAKFQAALRDKLIKEIPKRISETCLNGHPTKRLPNNFNCSIKYIEGESVLLNLDMLGIAASTGSACTSTSLEPSHVLLAIGLPHETAHGSLRVTLGRWTKEEDVDALLESLPKIAEKLRAMSPLYEKK